LKSSKILNEIVQAGEITADDIVLELGPGKGALTEKILAAGAKVLAIEKDSRLIDFLKDKFSAEIRTQKLEILEKDILKFNPTNLNSEYKLIANIPYYITGQIIELFLSAEKQPDTAVLMIQKEVCDRIIARDKKESILSTSVKAYCKPIYIKKVSARYFSPEPKVDSAILKLENISKKLFLENEISEEVFFDFIKKGFAHKRKILLSNLKKSFDKNIVWEDKFEKCNIDKKVRAENLSLQDWFCLLK
jgi:16S rRNA (adenine1518-N6/adenine1519-N6)-dimethyltransferase